MSLPSSVSATLPKSLAGGDGEGVAEEDVLIGAVEASQLDRKERSGWPVEDSENRWDNNTGALKLHHTVEDKSRGLRPYFIDIMEALRCHQDLQYADDDGALRAYVAKYVSKFSDSNQDEWLNDAADGNCMAATVLCRYKPCEPEMVLQMFGARFRQWHATSESGGKRDFVVPWPEKAPLPKEVELYMDADWAAGQISLLDFLRKTGPDGQILKWLKDKHTESQSPCSLEHFAANYRMAGEKLVAADMLSRLNDRFYGQWLMLHVPFRSPMEFVQPVEEQLALVPAEHRNFAMAILCNHRVARAMWQDPAAVQEELRMEAHVKPFQTTLLGMLEANKTLVQKYLAGETNAHAEQQQREENQAEAPAQERQKFNNEQKHIIAKMEAAVERSLAVQTTAEGDEQLEQLTQEALKENRIFVATGGPGTGKTTVALECVRRTLALGGKVIFVYPTNRQASRMRKRLPAQVDVNTYHAGFGLDAEPGNHVASLVQYNLIVVDEISQLQAEHFDHFVRLWTAADRLPAVLFAGDELQISGFGERAWRSRQWKTTTYRKKLHRVYRCKDPEFNKVLQELRTSRPKKKTLKWLQARKAWKPPGKPTVEGIRKLFKAHPKTVVLSCTRKGAYTVNQMALKALFPKRPPLVPVEADYESVPENWTEGELVEKSRLKLLQLRIYKGAKVCFTRNVR